MAAHADDSDHGCQGQRFLATMFLQSHTIAPLVEIHPSAQCCAAIRTGRNDETRAIYEKNVPEILTMCVVHFTIHPKSSKCPRNSNHTWFISYYSVNLRLCPTICMVGTRMMTDDDGIPTTYVVDLYIIE